MVGSDWLFIQPTTQGVGPLTLSEDRGTIQLALCAFTIKELSPEIAIHYRGHKNFMLRIFADEIEQGALVESEGVFSSEQVLYAESGSQIDVLSIFSPEVLAAAQNVPFKADIYIKHNVVYYILRSNKDADAILPGIIEHSRIFVSELEDNLHRWASSLSNKEKLKKIESTELSETLREKWERGKLN